MARAGLLQRVELCRGDAAHLPYRPRSFDAVFMSFALELFDTPEIPLVLAEIRRVLKPGGRFGLVSLSKEGERPGLVAFYEWLHRKWPTYFDCRPILPQRSLAEAGFQVRTKKAVAVFGLPVDVIVASRKADD